MSLTCACSSTDLCCATACSMLAGLSCLRRSSSCRGTDQVRKAGEAQIEAGAPGLSEHMPSAQSWSAQQRGGSGGQLLSTGPHRSPMDPPCIHGAHGTGVPGRCVAAPPGTWPWCSPAPPAAVTCRRGQDRAG